MLLMGGKPKNLKEKLVRMPLHRLQIPRTDQVIKH
jgi:hypothetical protein